MSGEKGVCDFTTVSEAQRPDQEESSPSVHPGQAAARKLSSDLQARSPREVGN